MHEVYRRREKGMRNIPSDLLIRYSDHFLERETEERHTKKDPEGSF